MITSMASKSINLRVMAAISSHKSIETTQRYIVVGEHQLRAAIAMA